MTIKSILFCLFLYVCLVWVGAAYLESGPKVEQFGLLWTAAGLIAVLAFIVLGRLGAGWGALRAKLSRPRQKAPRVVPSLTEDEAALATLLGEADAAFRGSAAYPAKDGLPRLARLPWYLLVGPEGAGKTSTFTNSGLEPQLLAGRLAPAGSSLPTQICNIWLARNAVFVEIAGRIFADPIRWERIVRGLRAKAPIPLWRKIWQAPEPDVELRGVIAFSEAKEFTAAVTPQSRERTERQAQEWQDRLRSIASVFDRQFPAYLLVTKADSIPFFADYFRRVKDPEVDQALGCTLPAEKNDVPAPADAETKRLTRSFGPLYRSLAERRLIHLAHEPDMGRRPGIYEFPRELKRLRSPLVQFLVDVFRPHPLRPGPVLRGYYFIGTREEENLPVLAGSASASSIDDASVLDATILFRGDATQLFRPDDASRFALPSVGKRARRWLFSGELFERVLLGDCFTARTTFDIGAERLRKLVFVSVCSVCLLLGVAIISSWTANQRLLKHIRTAESSQGSGRDGSLAALQSLESLRIQLSQLVLNQREGAPLHLRWGLYSGNEVLPAAKRLYFRRFQEVLLNNLDGAIIGSLSALPQVPGPNDPYEPAFSLLKTHLMISSASCRLEPEVVSKVLRETVARVQPDAGSEWRTLAAKQIDFYASQLPFGNPCHVPENAAARDRAREYLQRIQGADRIYARIIATGRKRLAKPLKLADLAPNFPKALSGQPQVDGVFSKDGWTFVEEAAQKDAGAPGEDACVTGEKQNLLDRSRPGDGMRQAIQQLYVRDYIERWRAFITSFSVLRYGGPGDAARKLEMLADHRSPLLAVFAMTSNQTNFPAKPDELTALQKVKRYFPVLTPASKLANRAAGGSKTDQATGSPALITSTFQPVQAVVPSGSDTWVVEKNSAYLDSLADLSRAMRAIADSGDNPDPAVHQAANQSYEKAMESVRQISKGFPALGVSGMDVAVEHLLEAPIRMAQGFIIRDVDNAGKQKVNAEMRSFCSRLRPILHKYPFSQSGEDATLEEVAAWFAPGSGEIWKFQAQSLSEITVRDGSSWKAKESAKKIQVTPELLTFLTRIQTFSDALYKTGSAQAQFSYILRPKLDASFKDSVIELEVDGQRHQWTSTLQQQFTWPASPLSKDLGARGRILTGSLVFPFASRGGIWGIFRVMGDAEPRALGSRLVEWKYVRGGDGRLEAMQPVRLEYVEFPGGADLFNPHFYDGLQCPAIAAQ